MGLEIDVQPVPLETTPDGMVRVRGTRVPLETIIATFLEGDSAEEIVEQYPTLQLADVYAVISYYLRNRTEVDAYLTEQREQAEVIRQVNLERFPQKGLRERLLARIEND